VKNIAEIKRNRKNNAEIYSDGNNTTQKSTLAEKKRRKGIEIFFGFLRAKLKSNVDRPNKNKRKTVSRPKA
jgi:hypothetical protein